MANSHGRSQFEDPAGFFQTGDAGANRNAQIILDTRDVLMAQPRRHHMARGSRLNQEKQWIEETFMKRECVKFVMNGKERHKCVCGRHKSSHQVDRDPVLRVSYPAEQWNADRNTEATPTDAYGTIEFHGGPHPTKARYIRLSHDTAPERVMMLLQQQWGLDKPNLVISVVGGMANFDLQPKLKRVFYRGLLQAAKITGAWIVTGGANTGVIQHVGFALGDTMIQARNNIVTIGIVPWGAIQRNDDLIGRDVVRTYFASELPRGSSVVLSSNHSYFLLVDDGTVGKMGCEVDFRKKLLNHIAQQKFITGRGNSVRNYKIPVVCLVLEGSVKTIQSVAECVHSPVPIPVVVCDGSGRASDLLSFTHQFSEDDSVMPEVLVDQLLVTIAETFLCSEDHARVIFTQLSKCISNRRLITIFRLGEISTTDDIDVAILAALLQTQCNGGPDQLHLALTWNRVDVARNYIFRNQQEWPEGSLDIAMMDALVSNREDFVELLIQNGVNLFKWLTIERLEDLYNKGLASFPHGHNVRSPSLSRSYMAKRQKIDSSSTLRLLLREQRKSPAAGSRYTLVDIGRVINKLMGSGYHSTYSRKKFRALYNGCNNKAYNDDGTRQNDAASAPVFKYPYSELLIWAVLLRRQKMAQLMWRLGDEALAKSLVAHKLYKSMALEAEKDELEIEVATELRNNAQTFKDLAVKLLQQCFQTDDSLTQLLLTYELANWSGQTCLDLAASSNHRDFIAHTACQLLLTEMWMGGLRTQQYTSIKVILAIMLPPAILFMAYRSREELQLMPQTKEEHDQEMKSIASSRRNSECNDEANDEVRSVTSETSSSATGAVKESTRVAQTSCDKDFEGRKASKSPDSDLLSGTVELDMLSYRDKRSPLTMRKKVYEFYTAPITKFWMHMISYVAFLLIFCYTVLIRTLDEPEWNEWYVVAFIAALALDKIREIITSNPPKALQKIRVFLWDAWNIMDSISIVLFFVGFLIRFIPTWPKHGRVFYCIAEMLFVTRTIGYFDISRRLGPFNHMIRAMVVQMINFVIFLFIIIVAYGVFLQSTWFPNDEWDWANVRTALIKPYFNLYGELFSAEAWPECDVNETGLAGKPFTCVPGRWLAPIVQSTYLLIGLLLMLTLLIAQFNAIFVQTNVISHQVWKFKRYKVVCEYEARPVLPPPFVIFCHIYLIGKYIRRKFHHKRKTVDNGLKIFLSETVVEQIHDFEEECLDAFTHSDEDQHEDSAHERLRAISQKLDHVMMQVDDVRQRENVLRDCLQSVDNIVARVDQQAQSNADLIQQLLLRKGNANDFACDEMSEEETPYRVGGGGSVESRRQRRRLYSLNVCDESLLSSVADHTPLNRQSTKQSTAKDQFKSTVTTNRNRKISWHPVVSPRRQQAGRPKKRTSGHLYQIEYSSITDDIDTSCVYQQLYRSPPNTPVMEQKNVSSTFGSSGSTREGNVSLVPPIKPTEQRDVNEWMPGQFNAAFNSRKQRSRPRNDETQLIKVKLQEENEFKLTVSTASTENKDVETPSEVVAVINHRAVVQDALAIHNSELTRTADVLPSNTDMKNQKVEPESRPNDNNTAQPDGFENPSVDVVNTASDDDGDAGTLESSFKSLC